MQIPSYPRSLLLGGDQGPLVRGREPPGQLTGVDDRRDRRDERRDHPGVGRRHAFSSRAGQITSSATCSPATDSGCASGPACRPHLGASTGPALSQVGPSQSIMATKLARTASATLATTEGNGSADPADTEAPTRRTAPSGSCRAPYTSRSTRPAAGRATAAGPAPQPRPRRTPRRATRPVTCRGRPGVNPDHQRGKRREQQSSPDDYFDAEQPVLHTPTATAAGTATRPTSYSQPGALSGVSTIRSGRHHEQQKLLTFGGARPPRAANRPDDAHERDTKRMIRAAAASPVPPAAAA